MTQSPIEPPNNPSASSSRSTSESAASGRTGASRPLTFDEGVALLVAFLSLGSVLFWGLTRGGMNLIGEAIADGSAITVENEEGEPITFNFDRDDSEIVVTDDALESETAERDADELSAAERALLSDRPRRRILNDAQAGVAGAAGGVAGATAIAEGAEAAPEATRTAEEAAVTPTEGGVPKPVALSEQAAGEPQAAVSFGDVPDNYWAKPYIDALSSRGLISGYEDGNFRPDQPVTRAQIANIVSRTFDLTANKENLEFSDVDSNFWARESIGEVVRGGFMTGFPNDTFAPNEEVTRTQSLTTLVTGLGIEPPTNVQAAVDRYTDANAIPNWATEKVAAATTGGLVVNYPNQQTLNPNQPTTRAELSALIYQALAKEGVVDPIESQYVVKP